MALLPYSVRQVTQRSKGRRDRGDRGDRGDREGPLLAPPTEVEADVVEPNEGVDVESVENVDRVEGVDTTPIEAEAAAGAEEE
jgi:hypothetical protein